jgi:hypothetical protein
MRARPGWYYEGERMKIDYVFDLILPDMQKLPAGQRLIYKTVSFETKSTDSKKVLEEAFENLKVQMGENTYEIMYWTNITPKDIP